MSNSRLLMLAACAVAFCGCKESESSKKAIIGATLIDGSGGPAIPDSLILIDSEVIVAAGPQTPLPDGYQKIDARGKFIVPGLVDVRVRIDQDPANAPAQLRAYLLAGITSIGAPDGEPVANAPHIFSASTQDAGIADLVIASGGSTPEATLAKIERMAKAEIAPVQILQAATQNGAAWLKQEGLGTIKKGQRPDLLLLSADPLADIRNLHKIERVMIDGRWVSRN